MLRLAALGEPGEQIAARLAISLATVRKHFENVYGKLGAHSRAATAATAWADAETGSMLPR